MKITNLRIQNFKSIHDMHIPDIENALILVGQNNTGKTTVLDAIREVGGEYVIKPEDFGEAGAKIKIRVTLSFTEEDMELLRRDGVVSQYRKKEAWLPDLYHDGEQGRAHPLSGRHQQKQSLYKRSFSTDILCGYGAPVRAAAK